MSSITDTGFRAFNASLLYERSPSSITSKTAQPTFSSTSILLSLSSQAQTSEGQSEDDTGLQSLKQVVKRARRFNNLNNPQTQRRELSKIRDELIHQLGTSDPGSRGYDYKVVAAVNLAIALRSPDLETQSLLFVRPFRI